MVINLILIIMLMMIAMVMTITLIATKQVKNFMDGAGIKEIWTSGRLCDAEVFFHFPENISILVGKLQKFPNLKNQVSGCEADHYKPLNINGWFWASTLVKVMSGSSLIFSPFTSNIIDHRRLYYRYQRPHHDHHDHHDHLDHLRCFQPTVPLVWTLTAWGWVSPFMNSSSTITIIIVVKTVVVPHPPPSNTFFGRQCAKKFGQGSPPPSPSLNWPNMYSLWKVDKKIKSHSQGPRSGDIHFDDDEDWTLGSERGTDVIQVHGEYLKYEDVKKTFLNWCCLKGIIYDTPCSPLVRLLSLGGSSWDWPLVGFRTQ